MQKESKVLGNTHAEKYLIAVSAGSLSAVWVTVTSGTSWEDMCISYYSFTLISKQ